MDENVFYDIEQHILSTNIFSEDLAITDSETLARNLDDKINGQMYSLGVGEYGEDISSNIYADMGMMYAITELLLKDNKKNPRRPANTGQSATAAGPIGSPIIVDQEKLRSDKRFKPGFIRKVQEVANALNVRYEHLLIIMAFESDGTFSPNIKNKYTGAIGLVGFMQESAADAGTTMAKLGRMTQVEQMNYVKNWFEHNGAQGKDFIYMYCCILFPVARNKPNDYVLFGLGQKSKLFRTKGYVQNKGLDLNKDKSITKLEACTHAWNIGIENLNGIIKTR